MGLLAILHRYGVNTALVAGLVLMPAVVAVGYWTDERLAIPGLALRGCIDGEAPAIPLPAWTPRQTASPPP